MQSLCISKSDFPCAQEARFSGNGRLFVDKNNDTARIDSWSTVELMILPHQSQPIRKFPPEPGLGSLGHHQSAILLPAVKAQQELAVYGDDYWPKSQENSTHIPLAVRFYGDCGTYWEYNSLVRPHFKLGLWNWIVEHHWAQRWISINCCSSWGKDTLTLCLNWRDWGAHEAIWFPLQSRSLNDLIHQFELDSGPSVDLLARGQCLNTNLNWNVPHPKIRSQVWSAKSDTFPDPGQHNFFCACWHLRQSSFQLRNVKMRPSQLAMQKV